MFNVNELETNEILPGMVFLKDKEPVSIKGQKVGFTSSMLRRAIMKIFDPKDNIESKVEKLIGKNLIIPFMYFNNSNDFIVWKLLPIDNYNKAVWGWYTGNVDNKIYVSLNSVGYINGIVDKKDIYNLLVHELMHLSANNFTNKFFLNFYDHLQKFYSNFIKAYFNAEVDPPKLNSWLKRLVLNEVKENHDFSSKYVSYLDFMSNFFQEMGFDHDKADYMLSTLMVPSEIYKKLKKGDEHDLMPSLHIAYKQSFGFRPPNFVFQELLYPSEVISVYSQYNKDESIDNILRLVVNKFVYNRG